MTPDKETILQVVEIYKQWCGEWTDQSLSDYVQEHWQEEDTAEVAANTFNDDIINELFGKTEQLKTKEQ